MSADDSLPTQGPPRFPFVKIAKVISVHNEGHAVDVIFEDTGAVAKNVPVLTWSASTVSGVVHLTAPTVDKTAWARKTYPEAQGELLRPPSYDDEDDPGRDSYVVVMQVEGSQHGITGLVAVGYLRPQVDELLMPNLPEFADLFLFRHPSDFEQIITHDGRFSLQHPSGPRITIGPGLSPARIVLHKRDHDKRYQYRRNLHLAVGIRVIVPQTIAEDDTESGSVVYEDFEPTGRHHTFTNFLGAEIFEEAAGNRGNIRENARQHIISLAGADRTEQAGGDISENAGKSIFMKAGTMIKATAPIIFLN